MTISEEKVGNVLIMGLNGKIDIPSAKSFLERATQILDGGQKRILLEFTDVNYINSSGLRALIIVAKRMGTSGGWLHLTGVNEQIRSILKISGLNSLFAQYPSKAEALEAFPQ
jgi:anti-sigma B factor antagonist